MLSTGELGPPKNGLRFLTLVSLPRKRRYKPTPASAPETASPLNGPALPSLPGRPRLKKSGRVILQWAPRPESILRVDHAKSDDNAGFGAPTQPITAINTLTSTDASYYKSTLNSGRLSKKTGSKKMWDSCVVQKNYGSISVLRRIFSTSKHPLTADCRTES